MINLNSQLINSDTIKRYIFANTCFSLKQHFYKEYQAEIGYKSSKSSTSVLGWVFAIWKYSLFWSTLSSKNDGRYSKKCKNTSAFVLIGLYEWLWWKWGLKWKVDHIDTTGIDLDLEMDMHLLNRNCVRVQWCLYVLSNN